MITDCQLHQLSLESFVKFNVDGMSKIEPLITKLIESIPQHRNFISNSKYQREIFETSDLSCAVKKINQAFNVPPEHDTYFVTRSVSARDVGQAYRSHFDSHQFTIAFPIELVDRKVAEVDQLGQLILLPNVRAEPNNSIQDFLSKCLFKRFSGKVGASRLELKYPGLAQKIELDYGEAVCFRGNTTLHFNHPIDARLKDVKRTTCLFHWSDPLTFNIGRGLRVLRRRDH